MAASNKPESHHHSKATHTFEQADTDSLSSDDSAKNESNESPYLNQKEQKQRQRCIFPLLHRQSSDKLITRNLSRQRKCIHNSWAILLVFAVFNKSAIKCVTSESNNSPPTSNLVNPYSTATSSPTEDPPSLSDVPPGTSWWNFEGDEDDEPSSSSSDYEGWPPLGFQSGQSSSEEPGKPPQNKAAPAHTVPSPPKSRQQQPPPKKNSANRPPSAPSQPLKTLEKLQQMLDDTDYMTTRYDHAQSKSPETQQSVSPEASSDVLEPSYFPNSQPQELSASESPSQDRLWTSADRSKYKQQQKRQRVIQEDQRQIVNPSTPISIISDDDISDTDDGLGYTLPNLPVYLSDAEADSDEEEQQQSHGGLQKQNAQPQQLYHTTSPTQTTFQQQQPPPPHPPAGTMIQTEGQQQPTPPHPPAGTMIQTEGQAGYHGYLPPPSGPYPPYQQSGPIPQQQYPPPQAYGPNIYQPNAYGPYPYTPYGSPYPTSPQQQEQQQQLHAYQLAQHYAAWAAAMRQAPPRAYGPEPPRSWLPPPPSTVKKPEVASSSDTDLNTSTADEKKISQSQTMQPEVLYSTPKISYPVELSTHMTQYASEGVSLFQ